ncbi:MAG: hypothetical protein ACI91F_002478 [Candidatus Binatia bacterium]|jgi:hypothetical protein
MDVYNCNYEGFVGVAAGDTSTIRVLSWEEYFPGFWSSGQLDPVFIQNKGVNAAAVEGSQLSQVYVVSSVSAGLYRFLPTGGNFTPVIPEYLGTLPLGYDIRGLSFGPAAPSGTTTTTRTLDAASKTLTTANSPVRRHLPLTIACPPIAKTKYKGPATRRRRTMLNVVREPRDLEGRSATPTAGSSRAASTISRAASTAPRPNAGKPRN